MTEGEQRMSKALEAAHWKIKAQAETIKMLRVVLGAIAWSNDSKWQSDAAKEALAATEDI